LPAFIVRKELIEVCAGIGKGSAIYHF